MTNTDLDRIFTFERLTEEQRAETRELFAAARQFAGVIKRICPKSREKNLAIDRVQAALLYSDAAIAIYGKDRKRKKGKGEKRDSVLSQRP